MAEAINHLAGTTGQTVEILRGFTDQELREQAQWVADRRQQLLEEPPDGKPYGNRYSAYRYGRLGDLIDSELQHRISHR